MASGVCGRDVRVVVRPLSVLAVCDPRASVITVAPDALRLGRPLVAAMVAQQAAHLVTPWAVQLRRRLPVVAPGTAIAVGLVAVGIWYAVTGRHAYAAYAGYTGIVVFLLAGWLPLAHHLRSGELRCDQIAAAAVGVDTVAAVISIAARWQAAHDSILDRCLDRAATSLRLSAYPTTTSRLAALGKSPGHGGRPR